MKIKCPAVVHVDGTARPQLIDKKRIKNIILYLKNIKNLLELVR